MVVPNMPSLKREILKNYDEIPMAGHGGVPKTHKAISEIFYWKDMRREIQEFVKNCHTCQQVKYSIEKKQGTLQPLPIPCNLGKCWFVN